MNKENMQQANTHNNNGEGGANKANKQPTGKSRHTNTQGNDDKAKHEQCEQATSRQKQASKATMVE
jgi:hypothetical protein